MKKGFTLVELLIVIAIIGILVGFSAVNLGGVRERARDGQRKADLKAIQSALELYRADQRSYPPTSSLATCAIAPTPPVPLTGPTPAPRTYMSNIPCDPVDFEPYDYDLAANGYELTACLENEGDDDRDDDDGDPDDLCLTTGADDGRVSFTVINP